MATTRKPELAPADDNAPATGDIVHTDPALTTDQRSLAAPRRRAAGLGGGVDDATRRQGYLDALAEERRGYVQRAQGATGDAKTRLENRVAAVDAEVTRIRDEG